MEARPALSKVALVALLLAVVGLAYPPSAALALAFGVAGLFTTRAGRARGRGLAIVALVLAPLTVLTTGLQAQQMLAASDGRSADAAR